MASSLVVFCLLVAGAFASVKQESSSQYGKRAISSYSPAQEFERIPSISASLAQQSWPELSLPRKRAAYPQQSIWQQIREYPRIQRSALEYPIKQRAIASSLQFPQEFRSFSPIGQQRFLKEAAKRDAGSAGIIPADEAEDEDDFCLGVCW